MAPFSCIMLSLLASSIYLGSSLQNNPFNLGDIGEQHAAVAADGALSRRKGKKSEGKGALSMPIVRKERVAYKTSKQEDYQCADDNRVQCSTDCKRSSPRCNFDGTNGGFAGNVDGPWIPCCEKRQFHEMLTWFDDLVQPHVDIQGKGFWYSLAFGTLLGAQRDGDMIDWDTDMDIVVPKEKVAWLQQILTEAAAKEDPPYSIVSGPGGDTPGSEPSLRLFLSTANEAHVDIWAAEGLDPPQPCVAFGYHVSPNYGAFPLEQCSLGKKQFPCVAQKQQYLKYWYGDAWEQKATNKKNPAPPALPDRCDSFLQSRINRSAVRELSSGMVSFESNGMPDFD